MARLGCVWLPALVLTLASCGAIGPAPASSRPSAAASASTAPTPAPPVRIAVGFPYEPQAVFSLAPDIVSRLAADIVFDGLVQVGPNYQILPRLADSWDISPDGLTYTFHLHRGVKWQDGQPFTANDVVFTYDLLRNPPAGAKFLSAAPYRGVVGLAAPDPLTVQIKLSARDAALLSTLTVGIVPQHLLNNVDWSSTQFGQHPVGTGPFKLAEWVPGNVLRFTANNDYFLGRAKADEVRWQVVQQPQTIASQVTSGTLDAGLLLALNPPTTVKTVSSFGGPTVVLLRDDAAPLQDARVRQALAAAIDRSKIAALVGAEPAATLLTPNNWAADPSIAPKFDATAAGKLLDQAGWLADQSGKRSKDGQPLQITLLGDEGRDKPVSQALQAAWQAIGVSTTVQLMDLPTLQFGHIAQGQFQAAILSTSIGPDPDSLRAFLSTASPTNEAHYSNPTLDQLLTSALKADDQAQRKAIYAKAQELVQADEPVIPLYVPRVYYGYAGGLQGIRPTDFSLFWNIKDWAKTAAAAPSGH